MNFISLRPPTRKPVRVRQNVFSSVDDPFQILRFVKLFFVFLVKVLLTVDLLGQIVPVGFRLLLYLKYADHLLVELAGSVVEAGPRREIGMID